MSKSNVPKKKVVVTSQNPKGKAGQNTRNRPARKTSGRQQAQVEMVFGKENFLWIGIGAVLIILGLLLMSGGSMDNPNEWNAEEIYSFRRTVLAPFVILGGLVVEIYAIFKK